MRKSLGSWALTAILATLTVVAGAAGCGGGGSSTPLTQDSFCDQKAQKECQVTSKCGTMTSACLVQRKAKCLAFAASVDLTKRQFTSANVSACISKTNTVYGLQMIRQPDLDDMNDVCSYVFQGTSTGVCTTKYDCAGKKICDTKSNGPLCATPVNKNKGDPCGNAGEICNAGAYCAQDPLRANAYYCLPKGMQGTACDAATPCVEALHCDAVTRLCAPRVMPNESCVSSDDCPTAAPYCDPYVGSKCDIGLAFAPTAAAACADYGGTAPAPGTGGSGGGTGGATGANDASSSG